MLLSLPLWLRAAAATLLAALLSRLLTPAVRVLAVSLGAVDLPGGRRLHTGPVPRLGGAAICCGFLAASLLFSPLSRPAAGLLLGAALVMLMGAADDKLQLSPGVKLLLQLAAAGLAVGFGLRIEFLGGPGGALLPLGPLGGALTLLWLVGCTNALNLIDGLDGLAAGVAAISAMTLLETALLLGEGAAAVLLAGLIGGCLGFLPMNLPPARIFMGDAGSQFLGFTLGGVAVLGTLKFHTALSFAAPVLALSLPLADTACSFFRRLLSGRSPFEADCGHFHHRLLALGFSLRQAVGVLYAASALPGLAALFLAGRGLGGRLLCLFLAALVLHALRRLLQRRGTGDSF